jgi:hypothetical protein
MHVFPIQFAANSVGETGNTCDLFLASEYVNKVEWDSLWGPSCVMGQEEWFWPLYLRFLPKIDRKGEVSVLSHVKSNHDHEINS